MSGPRGDALGRTEDDPTLTLNFTNCARCGDEHLEFVAVKFQRPPPDYTHWGTCPTSGEPVLVAFVNPGEPDGPEVTP